MKCYLGISNFPEELSSLSHSIVFLYFFALITEESEVAQSCPTLCDPIDGSPPGSPVPGTLQSRTLEWVAISFSNAWKWKVKVKSLSHVRLVATPLTAAYQAPPSMGFSRQEYWSGVPLPSLEDSTCPGATKPLYSYGSLHAPEYSFCNKRSHCNEKPRHRN